MKDLLEDIQYSIRERMISFDVYGNKSEVRLPIYYPSGGNVVVSITKCDGLYYVSDEGRGFFDAEYLGAGKIFSNIGGRIAKNVGVSFDKMSFFVARADEKRLPGTISSIAKCSSEAMLLTSHRLTEKQKNDSKALKVYDRLLKVFKEDQLTKSAKYIGESGKDWKVAASLSQSGRNLVLFDFVSNHAASIASTYTKFDDIAETVGAPVLVSVVESKVELGSQINILSRASNVIELNTSNETIIKLAEAA